MSKTQTVEVPVEGFILAIHVLEAAAMGFVNWKEAGDIAGALRAIAEKNGIEVPD